MLYLRGGHAVEQDGLGSAHERVFEVLGGAHFNLDALAWLAGRERMLERGSNAAAKSDVVVLDKNAAGKVDAVIGAAAAEHSVLFERPHAGDGFASIEHARVRALDRVCILARKRCDSAHVLQQVQNHALATQQHACVVANDGQHLAGMGANAVEDLGMAHDFESGLGLGPGVESCVDLKDA